MAVNPIPAGYPSLISTFAVRNAKGAIEFYQQVFGAELRSKMDAPDGTVAHAEMKFGDSMVMFGEATGEFPVRNVHFSTYVKDCDALIAKAVKAGATVKEPAEVHFYGDRMGRIVDPFGNEWMVATHVEDVSEQEMAERMKKLYGG